MLMWPPALLIFAPFNCGAVEVNQSEAFAGTVCRVFLLAWYKLLWRFIDSSDPLPSVTAFVNFLEAGGVAKAAL